MMDIEAFNQDAQQAIERAGQVAKRLIEAGDKQGDGETYTALLTLAIGRLTEASELLHCAVGNEVDIHPDLRDIVDNLWDVADKAHESLHNEIELPVDEYGNVNADDMLAEVERREEAERQSRLAALALQCAIIHLNNLFKAGDALAKQELAK